MNHALRDMQWRAVEEALGQEISLGTRRPVGIVVQVNHEPRVALVKAALEGIGFEIAQVETRFRLFGRRWWIFARGGPVRIERTEVEHWLDSLELTLAPYKARLKTWAPLAPAA